MDLEDSKIFKLLPVILTGSFEKVDVIFFHGQARGNDDDLLFNMVASLIKSETAKYVAVNGSAGERIGRTVPGESWAGKNEWMRRLEERGVKRSLIFASRPAFNTREESDAFLELAHSLGWLSAAALATPQHLLRVMLGTVMAMKQANYSMKIHPLTVSSWDWSKVTFGSQGEIVSTRFDQLQEEAERIEKYQKKGDLSSFGELVTYLRSR